MQEAQYCIHVYPQHEARTSWFSLAWSGTGGGGVSKKDGLRAFNNSPLTGSVELIKQKPEHFQSHFVVNTNK